MLIWTRRMQFWQPRRKCFDKKPKIFRWRKWLKKYILFTKKSSKSSFGQVECRFDNPAQNLVPEGRKLFTQFPKMIKKMYFFQKQLLNIFLRKFQWTRGMQFWQSHRKLFDQRPKIFRFMSENGRICNLP